MKICSMNTLTATFYTVKYNYTVQFFITIFGLFSTRLCQFLSIKRCTLFLLKWSTNNLCPYILLEIDLSENRVGEHGARALSGMLLENTTLVSLKLSGSHLDEHAARHLAPALVSNQKLQHLDLSHNRFGDIAGVRKSDGFQDNEYLSW